MTERPFTSARRGPYLAITEHAWIDVRTVVLVSETNPPDGPTRVVLDTTEHHCVTVFRPLGEVLEALANARGAWVRERAYEEEVGRLMALDTHGLPCERSEPCEVPPGAWDADRPFG